MNSKQINWLDKPFYSFDAFCKHTFHSKCYKISIDAGFTCPNRDGLIGNNGCIFCSRGGSGDFAVSFEGSMEQIVENSLNICIHKNNGQQYIAYFQAYTNTYAALDTLKGIYSKALASPHILGISIATRPDCINAEIIELLKSLRIKYKKFIWIELGLQTIHEASALFIRRGYPLSVFEACMKSLKDANIPVIIHVILGLPHETIDEMYETILYINKHLPFGIKLQLLHVLSDTDLGDLYVQSKGQAFSIFTLDSYIDTLIHCIELLSPDIVLHRVTGDGPKNLLLAPLWSQNKRLVLNTLLKTMKYNNNYQGRLADCSASKLLKNGDYYDTRSSNTL